MQQSWTFFFCFSFNISSISTSATNEQENQNYLLALLRVLHHFNSLRALTLEPFLDQHSVLRSLKAVGALLLSSTSSLLDPFLCFSSLEEAQYFENKNFLWLLLLQCFSFPVTTKTLNKSLASFLNWLYYLEFLLILLLIQPFSLIIESRFVDLSFSILPSPVFYTFWSLTFAVTTYINNL